MEFIYEPDLARATTLPASWYTDPAMLERENGVHHFQGLLAEFLDRP